MKDDPHAKARPEELRRRIDRGETGDKVDFADPAAAPLGTDDEAAGITPPALAAPPLAAEVAEAERLGAERPNDTGERGRAAWERPSGDRWVGRLVMIATVLVVAGVAFAALST